MYIGQHYRLKFLVTVWKPFITINVHYMMTKMRNLWTHVTICRIFGCLLSSFCYLGQCYLEWRLSSFEWYFTSLQFTFAFSALMLLAGDRNGIQPIKNEWWGTGMVICLESDADFHMTRLMPLPLTVSCFSKIQIDFTFLVPAHPGSPGKGPLNVRVCFTSLQFHMKCL